MVGRGRTTLLALGIQFLSPAASAQPSQAFPPEVPKAPPAPATTTSAAPESDAAPAAAAPSAKPATRPAPARPAQPPPYPPHAYPPPPYGYPPPGYYYWPPPPYYEARNAAPRELPYEDGGPVPDGYRVESRPRRGPIIAGSIMFGVTYLVNLLVASAEDSGNDDRTTWLYVPGVGTWAYYEENCNERSNEGCEFLVLHSLTHTAGAVLLVYGLVARKKLLVRNDVGFSVAPSFTSSGYGFAARARF
jgi:hypothetical protein